MRTFDSTCWSLVLGAAAGDGAARETFAKRYDPLIRAYLCARWRLSATHDQVSDGVQDVMIECLKPAGALERIDRSRSADFRGFLYGVTRRTAIMIERRRRRDARIPTFGEDAPRYDRRAVTLSAAFDRTWAQMVSVEALELLRTRLQNDPRRELRKRCLESRFVHDMPPRDIATALAIDVDDVYQILKQAKEDYRGALLEVVARHHPDATRQQLEDKCRELANHVGGM